MASATTDVIYFTYTPEYHLLASYNKKPLKSQILGNYVIYSTHHCYLFHNSIIYSTCVQQGKHIMSINKCKMLSACGIELSICPPSLFASRKYQFHDIRLGTVVITTDCFLTLRIFN